MKKSLKTISVIISSSLIMSAAATTTVFAAETDAIEKHELTAYLFNMEDTKTIECIFTSALPEVPYIEASDYVGTVYKEQFTETKNNDGTFTLTGPNGSMFINPENDTVTYDSFEEFMNLEGVSEGTTLDSPYCKTLDVVIEGDRKNTTIDLGKYNIDIITDNNKVYFPLTTISDLFCSTYNNARYVDGNLYFVHMMNETESSYVDLSSVYETSERSPEMVSYTYNELCFVADTYYGRPLNGSISKLVSEKGFDKALDEFSDDTRTAKELLKSNNIVDFMTGLCKLRDAFEDGGHTNLFFSVYPLLETYPASNVGKELTEKIQSRDQNSLEVLRALQDSNVVIQGLQVLKDQRTNLYKEYELIKAWDDQSASCYFQNGETGVFVFDSFRNEAVDAFKWSLDYAAAHGIKKFVVDISCNTGGNSAVVMYMIGIMTNAKDHSNLEALRCINTFTGNYNSTHYAMDLNLDGSFDELDNEVVYDFDYALITSHFSFSCGNLLPILAQDSGIPIFGQTSGGGGCMLTVFKTPEEHFYSFSGFNKFVNAKGEDADIGAPVNYDLTKTETTEDGIETVDYTGLYDINAIGAMMDEFYGKTEEPTKEEPTKEEPTKEEPTKEEPTKEEPTKEEPTKEEPTKEEPTKEEPAKEEPTKEEPTKEEPAKEEPIVTSGVDIPKTGDSSAWIFVVVMLAAGTAIVVFRKKKTE